ncbi:MAG: M36 family metallopeptidase [Bryobacteraceae bacterium]
MPNKTLATLPVCALAASLAFAQAPANVKFRIQRDPQPTDASKSAQVFSGTPQMAARAFLTSKAKHAEFDVKSSLELDRQTFVRFQQTIGGIPIHGRDVVVTVGSGNAIDSVSGSFVPPALADGDWKVSEADAVTAAMASQWPEGIQPQEKPLAHRVWLDQSGSFRPGWSITVLEPGYRGQWSFLVSAENGDIVEVRPTHRGALREGFAFPTNPVKGELERVKLERLGDSPALFGGNVKVFNNVLAVAGKADPGDFYSLARPDDDGLYPFQPGDPRFSEVQLYYNIDRVAERFKSIGFPGLKAPVFAVANYMDYDKERGFVPRNNAFFASGAFGASGGLFFYLTPSGGDTSYDADVIYHEYGHAVVNSFVGPDQSQSFGALNEGTADFFSSSFMNDPAVGEFDALIFRLRSPYIRTTDNPNRYPRNLVGEVHADGNMWSGALWELRRQLGAPVTDRIVLATIASLNSSSDFYDAAGAAVNAAGKLYGGQAATVVDRVMRNRGLISDAAEAAARAGVIRSGFAGTAAIPASDPGWVTIGAKQFRVQVSGRATRFKIEISGNGNLYALVRSRTPIVVNDDGTVNAEHIAGPSQAPEIAVDSESSPEIQTGVYYIAIGNAATVQNQVAVRFTEFVDIDVKSQRSTQIFPGTPITGTVPAGPAIGSRQFRLVVPPTMSAFAVKLQGDADVDLYIQQGSPVGYSNQGFPTADIVSDSDRWVEYAVVTNNNTIPALVPGEYWIAVANYDDSKPAKFRLEVASTEAPTPRTSIQALTPGAPGLVTMPPAFGAAVIAPMQLNINVTPGSNGIRLAVATELDTLIYVRKDKPVVVERGSVLADHVFRSRERGVYDIAADGLKPLEPGVYYVGIANASATEGRVAISYTVY